jgi:hypothetical protein
LWDWDIQSPISLNAVKASINANRASFTDFDSVKDADVELKRTENPTNDPRTRQVASVTPVGVETGVSQASMKADKDPRPLTNARRGLFPNLK